MARPVAFLGPSLGLNRMAVSLMACLVLSAQARIAPAEGYRPVAVDADASAAPWWSGFREPALAELQRAASDHAPALGGVPAGAAPLDAQVAAIFVATRILDVRMMVAAELRGSSEQLRRLAAAGPPTPERARALAEVEAQRQQAEGRIEAMRRQRDHLIDTVAAWCGMSTGTLPESLRSALLQPRIPSFQAEAPARIATRAEAEDRGDLDEVQARSRQVAGRVEVLKTRQMDVAASQRRLEVGAGTEADYLAAYQQWLLDTDALAVEGGELAHAWIRLGARSGGRAMAASDARP